MAAVQTAGSDRVAVRVENLESGFYGAFFSGWRPMTVVAAILEISVGAVFRREPV